MNFGAPYRPPCAGWPEKRKFWSGCYKHGRASENGVTKYVNNTQVENPSPPPATCSPYPKATPWGEPVPENTFAQSGTVDFARCRKIGHKHVQAVKFWHGRVGFLDLNGCEDTDCPGAGASGCGCSKYEPSRAAPPVKYLTQTVDFTIYNVDQDDPCNHSWSAHSKREYSVNRFSGVITPGDCIEEREEGHPFTFNRALYFPWCGKSEYVEAMRVQQSEGDDIEITETIEDDHYYFLIKWYVADICGEERFLFLSAELDVTLSDPYPASDADPEHPDSIMSDCAGMLATWPLDDDTLYPWRTDEQCTIAPLVTYDEVQSPVSPDRWESCDWLDPNRTEVSSQYTGTLRGAPLAAGYTGYFDFRHPNKVWDGDHWDIASYGANVPAGLPQNATQWTDNHLAGDLPPGAVMDYGLIIPGAMVAQKYAEVYIRRPAQNFFRPAGADRDLVEQTTINCATNPDGALRFPNAWPIQGRIGIVAATQDGGNVNVTLGKAAPFLRTGDHVDFTSLWGIANNAAVTVADSMHFTIAGALAVPYDPAETVAFVKSHGAPDYFWNDSDPKGDYVTVSHVQNLRAHGEWERVTAKIAACGGACGIPDPGAEPTDTITRTQECLSTTPCAPAVIYCSPNEESFENGFSITWPAIAADDRYGAHSQAIAHQHMPDLLWQVPHKPCEDGVEIEEGWVMDDGSCQADGEDRYYAQKPWVEARLVLPDGAPALPAGIDFPTYNVPGAVGWDGSEPAASVTAWGILIREHGCAVADGRFATEYRANGALN